MNIAINQIEPRLLDVRVSEEEIIVFLADGRTVSVPLAWSWRLLEASQKARQNFQIVWRWARYPLAGCGRRYKRRGYAGRFTGPATIIRGIGQEKTMKLYVIGVVSCQFSALFASYNKTQLTSVT